MTEYEDVGRRLRDTGIVSAPPRLRVGVLERVAEEPRRPRRAWIRPAVALVAAAACVLALGIGLAHLSGGGSSSSGASSSAAGGVIDRAAQGQAGSPVAGPATVVVRDVPLRAVGKALGGKPHVRHGRIRVVVPQRHLVRLVRALQRAHRRSALNGLAQSSPTVTVYLVPRGR